MTSDATPESGLSHMARRIGRPDAQQLGLLAAAVLTFFGVAYLGPALTRWTTPKTRAQRLKDEAAFQAERMRRRARKGGARVRKRARRLGGGKIGR